MLQHFGGSLLDGSAEQGQTHREIRVLVGKLHEHFPHLQSDSQFLTALPDQGLLFCFPRLHLAARKLPKEPPGLVGRPLADHECITLPNEGRYDFGHKNFLHEQHGWFL